MVDVVHKKCKGGCGKIPNSNYPNEKKALYCTACKKEGMVDVTTKRYIYQII
jgi:hypothetical protein